MIELGSFKVRGIVNQVAHIPSEVLKNKTSLVSMSAGNYGKAFAFASKELNLPATLCMPDSAPINRANLIEVSEQTSEPVFPLRQAAIINYITQYFENFENIANATWYSGFHVAP